MMGMLSGMKRRRRGLPLRALTKAARAAGNPGLDEEQQEILAAWLALPKAQQRAVVEEVLAGGGDSLELGDLPGEAAAQEPAEEAAEPAVDQGGGVVLPPDPITGGAWPEWNN